MNKFKLPLLAAVVLPLTLLTACGGGGGSGSGGTVPVDNTGGEGVGIPAVGVGQFAGSYSTGCSAAFPATSDITITNNTLTETSALYTDVGCTVPSLTTTQTWALTYTGGTTETDLGTAQHVNKTLIGFVFNGDDITAFSDKPTYYELILLDGINLYVTTDEAETPAERPTRLDSDVYVRQ